MCNGQPTFTVNSITSFDNEGQLTTSNIFHNHADIDTHELTSLKKRSMIPNAALYTSAFSCCCSASILSTPTTIVKHSEH